MGWRKMQEWIMAWLGQHTEECIWRGHGAGMAGEKAIKETVNTESLLDDY